MAFLSVFRLINSLHFKKISSVNFLRFCATIYLYDVNFVFYDILENNLSCWHTGGWSERCPPVHILPLPFPFTDVALVVGESAAPSIRPLSGREHFHANITAERVDRWLIWGRGINENNGIMV